MFLTNVRITLSVLVMLMAPAALRAQTVAGAFPAPPAIERAIAIDSLSAKADSLMQDRRFAAARSLFQSVATLRLESGMLPAAELRAIAHTYYFSGQQARAAAVLDELAEHAARYGDIVVQAEAYLDAAWLLADLRDYAGARRRLDRVTTLLTSPYLPTAARERLARRIR